MIHGLVKKGRVLGMDLVEIAPSYDFGKITMVHAERLICNLSAPPCGPATTTNSYHGTKGSVRVYRRRPDR